MTRAVIYARFSTELQSEKSTEDQIALCRAYAARIGLDVIGSYEDKARSGASIFGRDGLMRLMDAARDRAFEVVIVEALDRLSRDMEDLAGIHKRLSFLGVEIHAVHDGTADAILVGLRGLVGQLQREDGAKKVRRGMAGVIREGRHAGGRAYGYCPVPGRRGELEIVEEEAEIVRRIFAAYAAGRPPREIAGELNRDRIAPPRGTRWNASTINGNARRGNGLIFNELYAGRIVWNKVRMVKNPDTGKRISRPNPRDQWQEIAAPHLRIVDEGTWKCAQALKAEKARLSTNVKRRPAHLLSGLLRCGCCGSGMSVHDRDKTGKTRIRCSAVRENGSCSNRRILYLTDVEEAVLKGMTEELKDTRLIETYVRAYNEERKRLAATAISRRTRIERRRDRLEAERQRAIDMLIKGVLREEEGRARLDELRGQVLEAERELSQVGETPQIIALHPATLDSYIATVDRLAAVLTEHAAAEDDRGSLVSTFRALVHGVTVHPKAPREGFQVEVKGKLAALIGGAAFPQAKYSGGRVVAEERLEPPRGGRCV
ncbi:recombinase family protein [Methylocystis parvus]|uniref:Recombinase family protein n=1 Tax=Methylocystis parvus TaxID=134 RepID=A0A6B8MB44_9HYPH|nr:recombinase family protein [Methylocystis parvus]QGM99858.1 recombinase family protein [Methylocystis parvus]WBK02282.1 recombinase family protein [Methylocystis parvus OBBP]